MSFSAFKRPSSFLYDDNDDYPQELTKKIKTNVLSDSNTFGILSPPVTPEKKVKTVHISQSSISSSTKKLKFLESPYSKAKSLFLHGSKAVNDSSDFFLCGRQNEASDLKKCIENCLINLKSSSIYISGPPGTGKTAQINTLLNSMMSQSIENHSDGSNIHTHFLKASNNKTIERKFRLIKLNCMAVTTPEQIFKIIYDSINYNNVNKNIKKDINSNQLRKLLSDRSQCDMTLLVLDEMDNVINRSQQLLFELFSWASELVDDSNKPNLVLIGIANALDLTDRFLPRLRSNCINPKLIQFLPYTADQIKLVITDKLFSLYERETGKILPKGSLPPLIHPSAIQFCAKKAAVNTGDLRKAFDIIHKSIEIFEELTLNKLSVQQMNDMDMIDLPKLMISQVAKVCGQAFNSNYELKLSQLNLQQKTILTLLFKYETKNQVEQIEALKLKKKDKLKSFASINSFFEYYNEKLKTLDKVIGILKRGEFLEIISSLETQSLISLTLINNNISTFKSTSRSFTTTVNFGNYKISSNVPKMDFLKAIDQIEILKKIIGSAY